MRTVHTLIVLLAMVTFAAGAHASGLLVPTNKNLPPLRITDHLVDVTIRDQVGLTTVTQVFHNDTNQRLEATYIFPLPEQADLTDFQMSFNGKMVQGEVLPADKAKHIYESIVRQMKDPGLIEFIGTRLLRMRVFPIEPKSDTKIQVKYQQILRPISAMRGFHYPLRTSKTAGQAYGTVRFDVDLHSSEAIKNIWSPTHAVEIVRKGEHQAAIAYEASGGSLEEDFLLLYSTDESDLGLSVIGNKPNSGDAGHFLLMLTPKQLWPEDEYTPQDVVFVLDTSGSMGGDSGAKLKQAKQALKFCIGQLNESDRFSVVRFSTGFDVLFEDVRDANDENRKKAAEFVDKFAAAGGTNIADTLQHVAGMNPGEAERPFVVVFLTDGEGNRTPDEIMAVLQTSSGKDAHMRIFPFGVGHDVNTKLLDQLANSYHARPTYVQPGENLELVLGDFFATISQPVLTNLRLEIPDIGVTERFPPTLGDLYHGQQLTIAAKFSEPKTGTVTLTAMRNGAEVRYTWPDVSFSNTAEATYVPSIWAGRKIAYLIDEIRMHGENDEMIKEVIALSQEYGIQTPYTSWLVNPEQHREILVHRGIRFDNAPGLDLDDDFDRREVQLRRLRGIDGVAQTPAGRGRGGAIGGGGGGYGGGGFSGARGGGGGGGGNIFEEAGDAPERLSLEAAASSVTRASGRDATIIARYQAGLREGDTRDAGRLNENILATRKINGRWYNRIGPFLVDRSVDEKTKLVVILFASEAYFELVASRPALRKVFAASPNVVVPLDKTHAAVIVMAKPEGEGSEDVLEAFSDEMREQFGVGESR